VAGRWTLQIQPHHEGGGLPHLLGVAKVTVGPVLVELLESLEYCVAEWQSTITDADAGETTVSAC